MKWITLYVFTTPPIIPLNCKSNQNHPTTGTIIAYWFHFNEWLYYFHAVNKINYPSGYHFFMVSIGNNKMRNELKMFLRKS